MFSHYDIWHAIDKYAQRRGLSVSALARLASLDPSSFNPSKRYTKEGKKRWPSTESISKILRLTDGTLEEFVSLLNRDHDITVNIRVPFILSDRLQEMLHEIGPAGVFNHEGYLHRNVHQGKILLPHYNDPRNFALEIVSEDFLPIYKPGTVLIISPETSIRRGNRILMMTNDGGMHIVELIRQTAHRIEFISLSVSQIVTSLSNMTLKTEDSTEIMMAKEVSWLSRIVWASQ